MFRKYPSLFLLLFCVAGILLADTAHLSAGWFLSICTLSCVTALWALSQKRTALAAVCFGLTLFWFSGFQLAQRLYDVGPYNVSHFADGSTDYQIWGTVRDWPVLKANQTELVISLDSLAQKQAMRVEGSILLSVSDTTTVLQRGDRVEMSGVIYPIRGRGTPWGFDHIRYVNLKGIFGVVYATTLIDVRVDTRSPYALIAQTDKLRTAIREALTETLPPVPAAVASGFLIGETRNIPPELYTYFRNSGTLHLLAVSGSNVATVLLFATVILWMFPFSRRVRSIILLIIIFFYTLLAYGEPSVVRASLMAALVLTAGIVERRIDLNNIIASAGLLILLFDPTQLFDAGTQMSFIIAWGLILAVPEITKLLGRSYAYWWCRWLVLPLLVCVAAQVLALPVLWYYYGQITLSGFLSNIVIIPLVTVAGIGVLVLLVAYLIWPVLGLLVGSLLTWLLQGTIDLIHLFATKLSLIIPTGRIDVWVVATLYLILLLGIFALNSRAYRRRLVVTGVIFINLFAVTTIWAYVRKVDDPTLLLFSIPGGTAGIVSQLGSTEADLVISGLRAREYDIGERILAPALQYEGITHLRRVIVRDAEYSALDDIGKLAHHYKQDTLWVTPELRNSANDAIAETGIIDSFAIVALGSDTIGDKQGYSAFSGGFRLQLDSMTVLFSTRPDQAVAALSEKNKKTLLILSSGNPMTQDAVTALLHAGADQIVCSYLAHEPAATAKPLSANETTSEKRATSLVDEGWARFNLKHCTRIE